MPEHTWEVERRGLTVWDQYVMALMRGSGLVRVQPADYPQMANNLAAFADALVAERAKRMAGNAEEQNDG